MALTIYLIGILDGAKDAIEWFLILVTIFLAFGFVLGGMYIEGKGSKSGDAKKFIKFMKTTIATALIVFALNLLIPSSKTAAAMYLIPAMAENEEIQKLPNNALKALNSQLESWIKDLSEGEEKRKHLE